MGEEDPVDGRVGLGADLGAVVTRLAALQHQLLLLGVVRVQLLGSDSTRSLLLEFPISVFTVPYQFRPLPVPHFLQ